MVIKNKMVIRSLHRRKKLKNKCIKIISKSTYRYEEFIFDNLKFYAALNKENIEIVRYSQEKSFQYKNVK